VAGSVAENQQAVCSVAHDHTFNLRGFLGLPSSTLETVIIVSGRCRRPTRLGFFAAQEASSKMQEGGSLRTVTRGYNPAKDDDDAVALDRFHEFAVDGTDSSPQYWGASRERCPGVGVEAIGPFRACLASKRVSQILGVIRQIVYRKVASLKDCVES
jgi:hypothetical protein